MGSEIYWILFVILMMLFIGFSMHLMLNIFRDVCYLNDWETETTGNQQQREMVRHNFSKNDVEDLTKFEGDFKTIVPRLSFVNEVDVTAVNKLLETKQKTTREHKNMPKSILKNNPNKGQSISKSVDNLECCDPTSIDVLKSINEIEQKAKDILNEVQISYENLSQLKYYEINEKFIRLQIDLSNVICNREELWKRRMEVIQFIEECQRNIKSKVL